MCIILVSLSCNTVDEFTEILGEEIIGATLGFIVHRFPNLGVTFFLNNSIYAPSNMYI